MAFTTTDVAAGKNDLPVPKEEKFLCCSPGHCSLCGGEMEHNPTMGEISCSQCGRGPNSFY
jgi:hypothetical protein